MATKLTNSVYVGSGDLGVFALPYGECSTAAATAAKTVTVQGDFVLEKGAMVAVKFTYTNSVASPTLNVTPLGGTATGAKSIIQYGTTAASTSVKTSWPAGQVVIFVYDGTYWQRAFSDTDTIRSYGSSATEVANTSSAGSASTVSRSDHVHALPARLRSNQGSTGVVNDPDNATETGFYYINPSGYSSATTNNEKFRLNPFLYSGNTGSTDYRLLVTEYSSSWIQQIATDFRSDNMYLRRRENGTWKSWVKISIAGRATSGNSGTAGTVAPNGHTHSVTAAGTTGNNTAGDTVSKPAHTHALGELKFAGTAAGHTHTWSDTSDGPSKTATVASSSHTHSVTASGSVGDPTTGANSAAASTSVASSGHTHTVEHTPAGSVGAPAAGANSASASTSVASSGHTHSASYTPAGSVPKTGTTGTTVASSGHTHSASYTPAGSVPKSETQAVSVGSSTHTHSATTGDASAESSISGTISSQRMVITGTFAHKDHTHSVTTGGPSATTNVADDDHTHGFTGTAATITTGTPSGTSTVAAQAHTHSFTGTQATITTGGPSGTSDVASTVHTHGFTGTKATITSGTPSGTTSVASTAHRHSWSGSAVTSGGPSATATVASSDHTHNVSGTTGSTSITPAGTISKGTGTSIGSTGAASTSSGHTYDAAAKTHNHSFSGTAVTSGTNSGTGFSAAPSGHTHTTN